MMTEAPAGAACTVSPKLGPMVNSRTLNMGPNTVKQCMLRQLQLQSNGLAADQILKLARLTEGILRMIKLLQDLLLASNDIRVVAPCNQISRYHCHVSMA